ncbi:MAG: helix-turn-helix transcriptional regulator [Synergistaceae bacterium]|nr:helix-turn-helix transcriptional regulator [Synergistaceae bacterium]
MKKKEGFARRLQEFRKKANLIQPELAELIGVSVITLKRWETGIRTPRIEEIKRLCEVLGCTEAELLNNTASENWELKLLVSKTEKIKGGTIDMTGTGSTATLSVGDTAMAITLSAGYPLWEDDEQFEGLIEDLRRKRQLGLKTRKEGW